MHARIILFIYICFMEVQYRKPNSLLKTMLDETAQSTRADISTDIDQRAHVISFWQPNWVATKKNVYASKNRALKTPEELWAVACMYFDYTQNTPIQRKEYIKTGPLAGTEYTVETPRPFNWSGLSVYANLIGIAANLHRYARNENDMYPEFQDVVKLINDVMFSQKFEGAAIGMYKENIIAREIGLADKQQTTVTMDQPLFNLDGD